MRRRCGNEKVMEDNNKSRESVSLLFSTTITDLLAHKGSDIFKLTMLDFWARGIGWSAMHKHRHNNYVPHTSVIHTYQPNRSF